jgi:hypothetical protein
VSFGRYVATMLQEQVIVSIFTEGQRAEYASMPVASYRRPTLRAAAAAEIEAVLANAMLIGSTTRILGAESPAGT